MDERLKTKKISRPDQTMQTKQWKKILSASSGEKGRRQSSNRMQGTQNNFGAKYGNGEIIKKNSRMDK